MALVLRPVYGSLAVFWSALVTVMFGVLPAEPQGCRGTAHVHDNTFFSPTLNLVVVLNLVYVVQGLWCC